MNEIKDDQKRVKGIILFFLYVNWQFLSILFDSSNCKHLLLNPKLSLLTYISPISFNTFLSVFCILPSYSLQHVFLPFPKYIGLIPYFFLIFVIFVVCGFFQLDSAFNGWQLTDILPALIFLSVFLLSFYNLSIYCNV